MWTRNTGLLSSHYNTIIVYFILVVIILCGSRPKSSYFKTTFTCIAARTDIQAIVDIYRIFIDIRYQDCGYYTYIINVYHKLRCDQVFHISPKSLPQAMDTFALGIF